LRSACFLGARWTLPAAPSWQDVPDHERNDDYGHDDSNHGNR
jgi:hypothetical protein